jgi:phospholipid-binding lipoprotein MlaA
VGYSFKTRTFWRVFAPCVLISYTLKKTLCRIPGFTGSHYNKRERLAMKKLIFLLIGTLFIQQALAESNHADDPWEGWNRKVFAFNEVLDTYAMKPLAKGYQAVAPEPVEKGVSNFFGNLGEVVTIVNDLLQGKFGQAANDTGRVLINSTLGVAGLFEVAEPMGLAKSDGEDFGQTLATWGTGQGRYLVLPFFGPSSLRDAPGTVVDAFLHPIGYVEHVPTRNSLIGGRLIDTRAQLLDAEKLIKGDKYSFIRDVYLQRREYLINDGNVEDDFGGYDEEDGYYDSGY